VSKQQSTTKFSLVYSASKKPSSRHLDKRCWKTVEFRQATAEEMKALPVCKHCAKRAELDAAKAAQPSKPARKPIARNEPTQPAVEPEKMARAA
jgi:hypothetical protein